MQRLRPYLALISIVAAWLLCASSAWAIAAHLPAVKRESADLTAPSAADAFYGAATVHTNSVDFSSVANWGSGPVEIKELAKGLGAADRIAGLITADEYANRVYEYVRANIEVEFRFGLGKGALGTIIDQSGTPFDQAHLMVELLREGGLTASYQLGTITLSAAQFGEWTGLVKNLNEGTQTFDVDAAAACRMLADGGIPAEINGQGTIANCGYSGLLNGASAVRLLHIWVAANGKLYDPSFRQSMLQKGDDLRAAMGCGTTAVSTCGTGAKTAAIGTGSGASVGFDSAANANYVQNVNAAALSAKINQYARSFQDYVAARNAAGESDLPIEDILPSKSNALSALSPASAALPYSTTLMRTWSGDIPDQFRTKVRVAVDNIDKLLFLDEITGYWLTLSPTGWLSPNSSSYQGYNEQFIELVLEGRYNGTNFNRIILATSLRTAVTESNDLITLEIDHPYYAGAVGQSNFGAYADETTVFDPLIREENVVNGNVGSASAAVQLFAAVGKTGVYSIARASAIAGAIPPISPNVDLICQNGTIPGSGVRACSLTDFTSHLIGLSWLSQSSLALTLVDGANEVQTIPHHSFGAITQSGGGLPVYTATALTTVSAVSPTSNSADISKSGFALGAAFNALEGSAFNQLNDGWMARSSVATFDFTNTTASNRFYQASGSNIASILSSSANYTAEEKQVVNDYFVNSGQALIGIVPKNGDAGTLTAPNFSWTRNHTPFLAYSSDASFVAYATTYGDKSGGGSAPPDPLSSVLKSVDKIKAVNLEDIHKIDLASGDLSFAPPSDISVGQGEFPYSLSFTRYYSGNKSTPPSIRWGVQPNQVGNYVQVATSFPDPLGSGWSHNFDVRASFSNDGIRGLGSDSAIEAACAVASIVTISDLWGTSGGFQESLVATFAANEIARCFEANVMTVSLPPFSLGFSKLPDGTFRAHDGGPSELVFLSGSRVPWWGPGPIFLHSYVNYSFELRLGDGAKITFSNSGTDEAAQTTYYANRFKANTWQFPAGVTVNFVYAQYDLDTYIGHFTNYRLQEVNNNLQRKLQFSYDDNYTYDGNGIGARDTRVTDTLGRTATIRQTAATVTNTAVTRKEIMIAPNSDTSIFEYNSPNVMSVITLGAIPVASSRLDAPHYGARMRVSKFYRPSGVDQAALTPLAGNPALSVTFDPLMRVSSTDSKLSIGVKAYIGGIGGEGQKRSYVRNDLNEVATTYFGKTGEPTIVIDGTGNTTKNYYDNANRLIRSIAHEGDSSKFAFDSRGNLIEKRRTPKPGSTEADIVQNWTYPEPGKEKCVVTSAALCNKPTTAIDAKGAITSFNYFATGLIKDIISSKPDAASANPTQSFTFDARGLLASTTDATQIKTCYTYDSINGFALQTAVESCQAGGLNLATTLTTNTRGDVIASNGPRTDVSDITNLELDALRRLTAVIDANSNRSEIKYDVDGLVEWKRRQTGVGAWATASFGYDADGRLTSETDPDNFVFRTYYDGAGRVIVTEDAVGRKARTVYDPAGRVLKVIKAWAGSNSGGGATTNCAIMRSDTAADPTKLQQCYQEYAYTPNGQIASVRDAKGNKTTYFYDGYDRLDLTQFPSKTAVGLSDAADYEDYGYDNNGNMISKRARDGRTITFAYDALNRLTQRVVPGSGDASGNYETFDFTYDLVGRQLTNNHWGTTIANTYDAAGRLKQKKHNNAKPVSYDYDPAGNVTHLTYPDGFVVRYTYDASNRVERVQQVNAPADTGYIRQFAHVGYDALSRRSFLRYLPNSFSTAATYGYSMRGDLLCEEWNFTGTRPPQCDAAPNANAPELAWDFSYNGVGQLTSEIVSDSLQGWLPQALGTDAYVANGLNQYSSIDGAAIVHDGNGNTTTDHRGRTYAYSAENQLYTVYQGATLLGQNVYYGDGNRRYVNSTSGGLKRFYYDGDQEIAEYNAANTNIVRRYIRLPGSVDEPLLMIDYSLNTNCTLTSDAACQRWAHQNRLGSVVTVTDSAGAVVERHKYGPYGEIGGSPSGFPFRFTGQKLDAETGLYYYKARFYDPDVGRFLQTDPIGYEDDLNLYAYVGNDPGNATDPDGEECVTQEAKGCGDGGVVAGTPSSVMNEEERDYQSGRVEPVDIPTPAGAGRSAVKAGGKAAMKGAKNAARGARRTRNPHGSKGKPDHQRQVERQEEIARGEAAPDETVVRERAAVGTERRRIPDVQTRGPDGRTRRVREVERHPNSRRVQEKRRDYEDAGIDCTVVDCDGNPN